MTNALQAMYSEDAFKPSSQTYCFSTKAKQEDAALVQIQERAGLLRIAITSTMVALTSAKWHLQQAAMELGDDLTTDIILTLKELDGPASTRLGHALRLAASSFNSLLKKYRKEAVSKSRGIKSELVEMLNREYPPSLGSLFKGDVESTVSNFLTGSYTSIK